MGSQARAAIFGRGAEALSRTLRDPPPGYGCPLCLRVFVSEALETRDLTLEHAPPEAVGGGVVCLTCRDCNGRSGREVDTHLVAAERLLDFGRGRDVELRARLTVDGITQRGRIVVESGVIRWEGVPKADPPGVPDQMLSALERLTSLGDDAIGEVMTTTFDVRIDERRVAIGWSRAAYLVAFAAFGYRYILQPSLDPLRAQMLDPASDGFVAPIAVDVDAALDRRMIFLTTSSTTAAGLHVCIGQRRVWLPHVDDAAYVDRANALRHVTAGREQVSGQLPVARCGALRL